MSKLPTTSTKVDLDIGLDMKQSMRRTKPQPVAKPKDSSRILPTGKGIKFKSTPVYLPKKKGVVLTQTQKAIVVQKSGKKTEKSKSGKDNYFSNLRSNKKTKTSNSAGAKGVGRRVYLNFNFQKAVNTKETQGWKNTTAINSMSMAKNNARRIAYISREQAAVDYAPDEIDTKYPIYSENGPLTREEAIQAMGNDRAISIIISPEDDVYDLSLLGVRFMKESLLPALSDKPRFYCFSCHYNTEHPHIHILMSVEKGKGSKDMKGTVSVPERYYKGAKAKSDLSKIMVNMAGNRNKVEEMKSIGKKIQAKRIGILDSEIISHTMFDYRTNRYYLLKNAFKDNYRADLVRKRLKTLRGQNFSQCKELPKHLVGKIRESDWEKKGDYENDEKFDYKEFGDKYNKRNWSFSKEYYNEVIKYRYRMLTEKKYEELKNVTVDIAIRDFAQTSVINKIDYDIEDSSVYILLKDTYGKERLIYRKIDFAQIPRIKQGMCLSKEELLTALGANRGGRTK